MFPFWNLWKNFYLAIKASDRSLGHFISPVNTTHKFNRKRKEKKSRKREEKNDRNQKQVVFMLQSALATGVRAERQVRESSVGPSLSRDRMSWRCWGRCQSLPCHRPRQLTNKCPYVRTKKRPLSKRLRDQDAKWSFLIRSTSEWKFIGRSQYLLSSAPSAAGRSTQKLEISQSWRGMKQVCISHCCRPAPGRICRQTKTWSSETPITSSLSHAARAGRGVRLSGVTHRPLPECFRFPKNKKKILIPVCTSGSKSDGSCFLSRQLCSGP